MLFQSVTGAFDGFDVLDGVSLSAKRYQA